MTTQLDTRSPAAALDDERRWQAVQEQDAAFDGAFVLAVRTTGIYCRPTCPARTPKRENVRFLASPEEAERAGFRACKRCRPDSQNGEQADLVRKTCDYIDSHLGEPPTLAELGVALGMSPSHLQRTFKRLMGISPAQYLRMRRLSLMKAQLKNGASVTSAMYEAGFGSSSRLYESAQSELGMTPSTYGKRGRGMEIGYVIVDCYLGRLLVAATGRGLCAVNIGDNDEALAAALHADFRLAHIVPQNTGARQDSGLERWVRGVLDRLDGQQPHDSLPLDLQATAFQRRVWQELQSIPYGETRTYQEIAERLGNPKAARAVGRACATNPVSIVIPCHRAVGASGSLTGYRWGIERKRALLEREQDRERANAARGASLNAI